MYLLILLVTVGSAAMNAQPPATAEAEIRVIDWNIHKGHRLDRIVNVLRKHAPDICMLQEVDRHVKRTRGVDISAELGKQLGMHHHFEPAFEELGQAAGDQPAEDGQAFLSKTPLRKVRVLRFEHQSAFWMPRPYLPKWSIMQRRKGGRIALIAEIEKAGKRVVLYNLHLESRNVSIRRAQLAEAIADARRYPPDTRVIFGGDLNSVFHPDHYKVELETAGYTSCLAEKALRTHVVFGALDWIFVRGPLACPQAGVIRGTKASDHDPVWANISLIKPKHPLSSM